MKRCAICKEEKPFEDFYWVRKARYPHWHSYCVPCKREYDQMRGIPKPPKPLKGTYRREAL